MAYSPVGLSSSILTSWGGVLGVVPTKQSEVSSTVCIIMIVRNIAQRTLWDHCELFVLYFVESIHVLYMCPFCYPCSVDSQWKGLSNGVSGLMCTSLSSIAPSSTYTPPLSFRPHGAVLGESEIQLEWNLQ